jgi:hypothetical protein
MRHRCLPGLPGARLAGCKRQGETQHTKPAAKVCVEGTTLASGSSIEQHIALLAGRTV